MSKPDDRILDPDTPVSAAEQAEAEALRNALETGRENNAGAFANALRLGAHSGELSPEANRALIADSMKSAPPAHGRLIRATFGGALVVWAAAAALVLYARSQSARFDGEGEPRQARSTTPLFSEPFRVGQKSARIDRIAIARADDFREDRFGRWGVR